jgi:hypothetical protein
MVHDSIVVFGFCNSRVAFYLLITKFLQPLKEVKKTLFVNPVG